MYSLGWTRYYQKFIPYFAELAEPHLHHPIKEVPLLFNKEQDSSLRALRKVQATSPELVHPKFDN